MKSVKDLISYQLGIPVTISCASRVGDKIKSSMFENWDIFVGGRGAYLVTYSFFTDPLTMFIEEYMKQRQYRLAEE